LVRVKKVTPRELERIIAQVLANIPKLKTPQMQVVFTKHATERAFGRGARTQDIASVLVNPTETIYDEVEDLYKSYRLINGKYIVVVHTKLNRNVKVRVITVIPMNREGASKIGFRV